MRTPLVWTLRVTISPWYSWPDFLKVPMLAMSLLLDVRARDHRGLDGDLQAQGDRRRTHLRAESAAEDGGGETFLPREEWAKPRGRKSHRRRCGTGDRGADVLWPDQAIRGPVARAGPTALRRRRGGNRVTRTRGRPRVAKERNPCVQMGVTSMSRQPARQRPHCGSCRIHRDAASVRASAAATALWSRVGAIRDRLRQQPPSKRRTARA